MTNKSPGHLQNATVLREDGTRGTIVDQLSSGEPSARLALQFDDGARVVVAATELIEQPDGTYRLPGGAMHLSEAAGVARATGELVIPVVAEELEVETSRVVRGTVHIHKRVETREEVVNIPVVHEEVVVEHVPVNTLVEGKPPEVREEDDVLVIPVLEEVIVVEKRLMLREVIRVAKHRTTTSTPQTVALRREVVDLERVEAADTPLTTLTDLPPSGSTPKGS